MTGIFSLIFLCAYSTVCKSCTVSFRFWLSISHVFWSTPILCQSLTTLICHLLHLSCTNAPSFYLPTLHQRRKRSCGSSRRIPLYIFRTFRRQGIFFLRVTACPWIRYIICVTVLLSTENRIKIHANSRRWHIANY